MSAFMNTRHVAGLSRHVSDAIPALKRAGWALDFDRDDAIVCTMVTRGYPLVREVPYTRTDGSLVDADSVDAVLLAGKAKQERENNFLTQVKS